METPDQLARRLDVMDKVYAQYEETKRTLSSANLRLVVKIAHEYRRAYRNLLDLIGANWTTQALATAAELGLADKALKGAPRDRDAWLLRAACSSGPFSQTLRYQPKVKPSQTTFSREALKE